MEGGAVWEGYGEVDIGVGGEGLEDAEEEDFEMGGEGERHRFADIA